MHRETLTRPCCSIVNILLCRAVSLSYSVCVWVKYRSDEGISSSYRGVGLQLRGHDGVRRSLHNSRKIVCQVEVSQQKSFQRQVRYIWGGEGGKHVVYGTVCYTPIWRTHLASLHQNLHLKFLQYNRTRMCTRPISTILGQQSRKNVGLSCAGQRRGARRQIQ